MPKLITPADVFVAGPATVSGTGIVSLTAIGTLTAGTATATGGGSIFVVPKWSVLGNIIANQGTVLSRDLRPDITNYQIGDVISLPNGAPPGWTLNVDGFTLDYDGVGAVVSASTDFSVRRASLPADIVQRVISTLLIEATRPDVFGILANDLFASQVSPVTHSIITQPVGINPPTVATDADGSILIDAATADFGSYFAEYNLFENGIPAANNPGRIDIVVDLQILTIPDIAVDPGITHNMAQYIDDPTNSRISTTVIGLSGFATYDPVTELLTGVSTGTESGLVLEVNY